MPLTGSSEGATAPWLIEFCKHLEEPLRSHPGVRKKLKAIMFIANKADRLAPDIVTRRIESLRKIVKKHLGTALATKAESVPVLPCILIQSDGAASLADAVIVRLAKLLAQ